MLDLSEGRLPAQEVLLGAGAVLRLRPATTFEARRATAKVVKMIAGLIASQDAAARAVAALGEDYAAADFSKPEWVSAATEALIVLELAWLCQEGWTGVSIAGTPVEATYELLAVLLRDAMIAKAVEAALNSSVHREQAEGNGLTLSPNGAARADEQSAPPVETSTPPAAAG